jgi:hypothetical protein
MALGPARPGFVGHDWDKLTTHRLQRDSWPAHNRSWIIQHPLQQYYLPLKRTFFSCYINTSHPWTTYLLHLAQSFSAIIKRYDNHHGNIQGRHNSATGICNNIQEYFFTRFDAQQSCPTFAAKLLRAERLFQGKHSQRCRLGHPRLRHLVPTRAT